MSAQEREPPGEARLVGANYPALYAVHNYYQKDKRTAQEQLILIAPIDSLEGGV